MIILEVISIARMDNTNEHILINKNVIMKKAVVLNNS